MKKNLQRGKPNIEHHQTAISNVRSFQGDETSLCAVLGQHLFSPLCLGHKFVVDENAPKKQDVCPCQLKECKKPIMKGCTAIGSGSTWHGYADIYLDQKIPVVILKEGIDYVDKGGEREEDGQGDNNPPVSQNTDDDEDDADNPPAAKKMRTTADLGVCVEVKNKSADEILLNLNVIDRIIAEAITNAVAQLKKNECLSGWLIPTFGCSTEQLIIFMYDPENDILLQSLQQIKLWESAGILDIYAVIQIWMFINFTYLTNANLAKKHRFMKSRFHICAKDKLEDYKQVACREKFVSLDNNYYADVVLPRLSDMLELVDDIK